MQKYRGAGYSFGAELLSGPPQPLGGAGPIHTVLTKTGVSRSGCNAWVHQIYHVTALVLPAGRVADSGANRSPVGSPAGV